MPSRSPRRRSPLLVRRALAVLAAVPFAAVAPAQNVAVLYTTGPSNNACWGQDPAAKIASVGYFANMTAIDVGVSTPTLTQLLSYDAVMVMQDYPGFQDEDALGDALADYADLGRGVVIAGFACYSNWQPLGGRWGAQGYFVIQSNSQTNSSHELLGTVHDASHMSMLNVTSFDGGQASFRPDVATIAPGGRRIADWGDGRPLVAQGALPNRIDLGFFPPSTDCTAPYGWESSTDGALLMANSLLATIVQSGTQQATNTSFGAGCGGLTLAASTRPLLAGPWTLELGGVPASAVLGLVLVDTVNPALPLGAIAPGCTLYSGGLLLGLIGLPSPTPSFGLSLPANPVAVGVLLYAQGGALVSGVNPLNALASNGIEGRIGDF